MKINVQAEPDGLKICEPGGKGLVLPLDSDRQDRLPNGVRGIFYAIALAYCFLGVSIVADTFMGSIEAVTSRRRQLHLKSGRIVTVRVWNDTVANLTLMALGSSAPEILLSVIELFKNNWYSGDLGPSTIVGSAAFNLLVIVAICIIIIPSSEHRKVRELNVLYITLVFSLFAYLWLLVILSLITPDVVDFWEALVTFLCFPVLVCMSWMADTGKFGKLLRRRQNTLVNGDEIPDEVLKRIIEGVGAADEEAITTVKKGISNANLGSEPSTMDVEALINTLRPQCNTGYGSRKSRATHRMEATRAFTGGKKAPASAIGRASPESGDINGAGASITQSSTAESEGNLVMFMCDRQCLSCNLAEKPVELERSGDLSYDVIVEYAIHLCPLEREHAAFVAPPMDALRSASGEALPSNACPSGHHDQSSSLLFYAGREVHHGSVLFQAGEQRQSLVVARPNGGRGVPAGHSEDFVVRLKRVEAANAGYPAVAIGPIAMTQVTMAHAGAPGRIAFAQERVVVQGTTEAQSLQALVLRRGGCCGTVSVNYHTEKFSAIPGFDYSETDGVLEFAEGVTEQPIELEILPKGTYQWTDEFLVLLEDAEGGAEFDPTDDGGKESSILTVTINALEIETTPSGRLIRWVDHRFLNLAEMQLGKRDWKEQLVGAVYCNGSLEEQKEASKLDWTFHLLSLPWKLLFTLVPPTSFCNGWVCFYTSLLMIGAVTGIIGDLAELFGCVLDVPDAVTAITFVALGTSMPDLFASQSAAIQDPWADASICNVTGSNSVNVFLGLGLPWTMGAIHWNMTERRSIQWERKYPDIARKTPSPHTVFAVPAGNLGFSVLVYAGASLVALGLLQLRRSKMGYELGGPWKEKVSTGVSFIILWLSYIALASWQVLRSDKASSGEQTIVIVAVVAIASVFVSIAVVILLRYEAPLEETPTKVASTGLDPVKTAFGATAPQDTDGVIDDYEGTQASSTNVINGGAYHSRTEGAKEAHAVAPPDVAAGIPMREAGPGIPQGPSQVLVEISDDMRSPPPKNHELNAMLRERPVQPPLTPDASLDLMARSPPLSHTAYQDAQMNALLQDRRFVPNSPVVDNSGSAPVVHLPNVTRDAALLDPNEGGVKRSPSPQKSSLSMQTEFTQISPTQMPKPSAQAPGRGSPPREPHTRGQLCL